MSSATPMLPPHSLPGGSSPEGVSRRDFLRVGSLSVVGLSVAESAARSQEAQLGRSCILILMTGGASQLDTFDPKPEAPAEIRGPSRAVSTAVPGIAFSESLPRLAARADRFATVRSLGHNAAPIHEAGLQLLQTGRLIRQRMRFPSFGSVVASALGPRRGCPPYVVVGGPLRDTGVSTQTGQSAGDLGKEFDPVYDTGWADELKTGNDGDPIQEPEAVRRAYGNTSFGRRCLRARQLVERGVRCVTVNLFDALEAQATWDCHGRGCGPATLYDYRDSLGPQFDQALSALIDDLEHRGLYESTLVIATGEFGRAPRVNESGGREHWPGVWSALVGGCGVRGGAVIGASDSHGAAAVDAPIAPGRLVATVYERLGVENRLMFPEDERPPLPLTEHPALSELF